MREPKPQSPGAVPAAPTPPAASDSESARMTDRTEVSHAPALQTQAARRAPLDGAKSSVAPGPAAALGMRPQRGGLAARTASATNALPQARLGRSPASVVATLHRSLASVDVRLVSLLLQPYPTALAPDDGTRLEIALLTRLHETIVGQTQQMQDDAVLIDSLAEFAEAATATVLDLEAGGTRALDRWLDFVREQTSALAVLGGQSESAKKSIRALRQAMVPLRELSKGQASLPAEARSKLKGFRAKVVVLCQTVIDALYAASPKAHTRFLDHQKP